MHGTGGNRSDLGTFSGTTNDWTVIAAAAIGAVLGSRILAVLQQAPRLTPTWQSMVRPGGKTIVGGLLGGWVAVEMVKQLRGIPSRTGDLFVVPLCIGIAVGRVGCLLPGLADDTYGTPTTLHWGVDFGDGIVRHPTQLYEVVVLGALGFLLNRYNRQSHPEGATFRLFMAAYLAWRLAVDFIKPQPLVNGLSLIQWSCVAGLVALAPSVSHVLFERVAQKT